MNLDYYGYNEFFQEEFDQEYALPLKPARIIAEHKSNYIAVTETGEMPATLSGKYRYSLAAGSSFPTAGDYVAVQISEQGDRCVIQGLLPRRTCFIRSDSWDASGVQTLCANFDTVFICMSLNKNFNTSRLERYLIMAKESRADIAVILTKADLCPEAEIKAAICEAVCKDVPVYAVSAFSGLGMDKIRPYFDKGKTVAALGSSGVGKSTLVNALFGKEIMKTSEAREDDDRGRHTTVHRQIILLPSGGLYIDTPGLREIGLAQAEDSVSDLYSDIEEIMTKCRFSDCRHNKEPGCALRAAIESGEITQQRYEKYLRYKKEAGFSQDKAGYIRSKTELFKSYSKLSKNIEKMEKKRK